VANIEKASVLLLHFLEIADVLVFRSWSCSLDCFLSISKSEGTLLWMLSWLLCQVHSWQRLGSELPDKLPVSDPHFARFQTIASPSYAYFQHGKGYVWEWIYLLFLGLIRREPMATVAVIAAKHKWPWTSTWADLPMSRWRKRRWGRASSKKWWLRWNSVRWIYKMVPLKLVLKNSS
jgi:hypothetical protein